MMMHLSHIYIYPIKSLEGIAIQHSNLDCFGLENDRRWMLVDDNGLFVTQRKNASLCHFKVKMDATRLTVTHQKNKDFKVVIPIESSSTLKMNVQVWDDQCEAQIIAPEIDNAFSQVLGESVHLVKMPLETKRQVNTQYAELGTVTAFSDGFPLLIIGQASLDHLNSKLDEPLTMQRFRPNLVFEGGEPHLEDQKRKFSIGSAVFKGVKPCSRCVITTINPSTAQKGVEPLRTLSTYRLQDGKVMFGMNVIHQPNTTIKVGDEIKWI